MNILIVKTSAIGDVVHTLPALVCLRKHYPKARIDWVVEEAASAVVSGHWAVDRVYISRRKQWVKRFQNGERLAAIRSLWRFIKELRQTRYDLLIDFQGLLKSSIFVFWARARRKVGFGRGMEHAEGSWLFLNERKPPVNMDIHALDRELELLKAINISCKEVVFDFPIGEEAIARADSLLAACGVASINSSFVAINPMTTWPTKHWYDDGFSKLADRLADDGLAVVFTGSEADTAGIERILAGCKKKHHSLAGKTDLKSLAAIYQRSALTISTDTGPMHIAVAVGSPVIGLFGPTAPWRTGPYGDNARVVRSDLPCSPCFKKECDLGHPCMRGILVDRVMDEAKALVKRRCQDSTR